MAKYERLIRVLKELPSSGFPPILFKPLKAHFSFPKISTRSTNPNIELENHYFLEVSSLPKRSWQVHYIHIRCRMPPSYVCWFTIPFNCGHIVLISPSTRVRLELCAPTYHKSALHNKSHEIPSFVLEFPVFVGKNRFTCGPMGRHGPSLSWSLQERPAPPSAALHPQIPAEKSRLERWFTTANVAVVSVSQDEFRQKWWVNIQYVYI